MKNLTPTEKYSDLAKAIGCSILYFKREDLHPYGSHKGRSIPVMIDHYIRQGHQKFALSSSGNAGLAAVLHVSNINKSGIGPIELIVYVGQHSNPHKVEKLKQSADEYTKIILKERPLQALTQSIEEGYTSLRQSTDDLALQGYDDLAEELLQVKDLCAVFIGTSSGTTAEALAKYFAKNNRKISVNIVQTSSCHPMSDAFEAYDGPDEPSIADAIVDVVAHRKSSLIPAIEKVGGTGFAVTNDEILLAMNMTHKNTGLEISPNSALSVAGIIKATGMGVEYDGSIVCMICGD